jgi:hypothetical protein
LPPIAAESGDRFCLDEQEILYHLPNVGLLAKLLS